MPRFEFYVSMDGLSYKKRVVHAADLQAAVDSMDRQEPAPRWFAIARARSKGSPNSLLDIYRKRGR